MDKVGIYQIRNSINNKKYIGKSHQIETRLKDHFQKLRKRTHKNYKLQSDFDSFGEECFETSILEECEFSELTRRESILCHENDVWDDTKGYNIGALSDYRRVSKEEAIYYKNLILNFLYDTYRSVFYRSRHFSFRMDKNVLFFDLDYEEVSIALNEINDDDMERLNSYITVNKYFTKLYLDFYPHNLPFADRSFFTAKVNGDSSENEYVDFDFFKKHNFLETISISNKLDSLWSLNCEPTIEMIDLNTELKNRQKYNLQRIMNMTNLKDTIKLYFEEEFIDGNIKTKLDADELAEVDLVEPLLEDFLYDDNGYCGMEFFIYLNTHPIFKSITDTHHFRPIR